MKLQLYTTKLPKCLILLHSILKHSNVTNVATFKGLFECSTFVYALLKFEDKVVISLL